MNENQETKSTAADARHSSPTSGSALLIVEAGVRYWEDASVNGQEDTNGDQIPFRDGDLWKPVIDLETGMIRGWPQGTTAFIHYKVCDAGEYWIADSEGRKIKKWSGHYVPDRFLCFGDRGYGDYIILTVESDGRIEGWKKPDVLADEWEEVQNDRDQPRGPSEELL